MGTGGPLHGLHVGGGWGTSGLCPLGAVGERHTLGSPGAAHPHPAPHRFCTEGKRTFSSRLILEKHIQVRHGIKVTDQTKSQEVIIARIGAGAVQVRLRLGVGAESGPRREPSLCWFAPPTSCGVGEALYGICSMSGSASSRWEQPQAVGWEWRGGWGKGMSRGGAVFGIPWWGFCAPFRLCRSTGGGFCRSCSCRAAPLLPPTLPPWLQVPGRKRKLSSDDGDSCSEEPDSTTPPSKNPKGDRKAPFRCRKCGYVASSAADFQEHIPQHRTDESSHQCRECGLCFTSQVSLNRHRFITHKKKKGAGEAEEPGPRSPLEGAPHAADGALSCTVCGRSFDSQLNLKTHFRTHGMAFIRARQNVSPEN